MTRRSHHQAERDVWPEDRQRPHIAHDGSGMGKRQLLMLCASPLAAQQPICCARPPAGVPDGMKALKSGTLAQRQTAGPLQLGCELGAPCKRSYIPEDRSSCGQDSTCRKPVYVMRCRNKTTWLAPWQGVYLRPPGIYPSLGA